MRDITSFVGRDAMRCPLLKRSKFLLETELDTHTVCRTRRAKKALEKIRPKKPDLQPNKPLEETKAREEQERKEGVKELCTQFAR